MNDEDDSATELQSRTVSWSITGQYIAEMARGLVLSGQWREALNMLVEDCGEMTHEVALSILRGDKTLIGDSASGISLGDVDPNDQSVSAYLGNFNYMFAGLWKHSGKVYKPYARVHSFDTADLYWAGERYAPWWNAKRSFDVPFCVLTGRVKYYADDSESHLATIDLQGVSRYMTVQDIDHDFVHENIRGGYLWKPVDDYPLWVVPHKKCEDALKHALDNRRQLRAIDCPGIAALRFVDSVPATVPRTNYTDFEIQTLDEFEQAVEESVVAPEPVADPQESKRLRRQHQRQREMEEQAKKDAARVVALKKLRQDIIKVNGEGDENWIRLPIHEKIAEYEYEKEPARYLPVPRAPFLNWVYSRSPANRVAPGLVPTWRPLSPMGLKMYGDDPNHTDWVVGAGLDPQEFYKEDAVNAASYRVRQDILSETLKFDCDVFTGSGWLSGKIQHLKPGETVNSSEYIGVIPTGGMEFDAALRSAVKHKTAIIMVVGGKLCHAVTVARETGLKLIMWPKAEFLRDGDLVWLDLDKRTVKATGL